MVDRPEITKILLMTELMQHICMWSYFCCSAFFQLKMIAGCILKQANAPNDSKVLIRVARFLLVEHTKA
jgi:hypothetical protein